MIPESGPEDVIIPDENGVLRRLMELGVPLAFLQQAVERGARMGDLVYASHPRFYQGVVVYSETNAGLRDQFATLAWTFNDEDNIPRVVSPDGRVVLTAVSGNERTGLRHGEHAQTRRPRRSAGFRIVRRNAQFEIEDMLPEDQRGQGESFPITLGGTWFLLYYRDGDILRSELSFARGVSETGNLLEWSERLPLPDLDLLDGGPSSESRRGPDDQDDVDVPVERRAS